MEHLIEEILWLQDKGWLRGFVFGLVHTIIPLIGFYSGWSLNRMLKLVSNGYIAGIIGVVFAHVIADYIAATLDPNLRSAATGIVLGGLVPLILIPVLDKYVVKSKHHIVVGDHDDLKKDLKQARTKGPLIEHYSLKAWESKNQFLQELYNLIHQSR